MEAIFSLFLTTAIKYLMFSLLFKFYKKMYKNWEEKKENFVLKLIIV